MTSTKTVDRLERHVADHHGRADERVSGLAGPVVGSALAAQAAVSALQQGLPSLSAPLAERLGLTLPALGWFLGAANLATAVSVVAWGAWSDRAGDRRVLLTGLPMAAMGLLMAGVAVHIGRNAAVLVALLVAGTGAAAGSAALSGALATRVAPTRLGLALGLRQAAVPVGALIAAAVLPTTAAVAGTAAAFVVLAGLMVGASLGVAVWLPPRPAGPNRATAAPEVTQGHMPAFRRLFAGYAALCVAQTGVVVLSVTAWHRLFGLTTTSAGLLFATVQVGTVAARVAMGRAADRRPGRESSLLSRAGAGTAAALLLLLAGHRAGLPPAVQAGLLLVACLPAGAWNGVAFAQTSRWLADAGQQSRLGVVHGAQNAVLFAAVGLTPPAAAALAAAAGWPALWAGLAAAALLGARLTATTPSRVTP